ncbi:MAG: class I SAM-dependent methyltransferase [Planctomycetota bacterium]
MSDKLHLQVTGVVETMLWPLYNRAVEARRRDAKLVDPEAVRIADSIDYDYAASFGKPNYGHVLRCLVIDRAIESWLEEHPDGVVVGLGEGLETQFSRVDNGRVRWLSVDVENAIEVRKQFLPDTDRHRNFACSALDFRWMDEVEGDQVFVTLAGLLMYFEPDEVRGLLCAIAERFPHSEMMFDVIPPWLSEKTQSAWKLTPNYTTPRMPWGILRDELPSILEWHPNLAEIEQPPSPGRGRGFLFGFMLPIFECFPSLCNKMPTVARVRCRNAGSSES